MNMLSSVYWAGSSYMPFVLFFIVGSSAILFYQLFKRHRAIGMLVLHPHAKKMVEGYSLVRVVLKTLIMTGALVALSLALLRPQWDKKEETVTHQTRDLLIALDISRSMLCQDGEPDRLGTAKKKIRTLVNQLSCERIGLLLFAGSPYLACPLTTDYDSFFMFLDQLDSQTVSSAGTDLDAALNYALDMFAQVPERKNKIVVLFTDGEDFSGNSARIKERVSREGLYLFACGIGTSEGAPVPVIDRLGRQSGFEKKSDGSIAISRLDHQMLQDMVSATGGTYITITNDDHDMRSIVQGVSRFEKEKLDERKKQIYQEKYYYPAAVGAVLLLLEWLL